MPKNNIPIELKNARGLQKLKALYAEHLKSVGGDEKAPSLRKLRSDIRSIERALVGKPIARTARP